MPFRSFPGKPSIPSEDPSIGAANESPTGILVAHIDGGARGNPGPAGYGVLIEDEEGRPVAQLSEYLGKQTNNYAEYSGLLAALSYAVKHGFKLLKVISDSELLVKQIKGQYKVNNQGLKELYGRATKLIGELDYFRIEHVLREQNREADRLANLAMDHGMTKMTSAIPAAESTVYREVNGLVQNGVVKFLGDPLPEGMLVKIRPSKT